MQTPDFSKFKSSFKTDEEFNQADQATSNSKFFRPGLYEVSITKAEFSKKKDGTYSVSEKDPTWMFVDFYLQGAGEQTIRHSLLVPTANNVFMAGGKPNLGPVKRLVEFLQVLGIHTTPATIGEALAEYFSDMSCFTGAKLKATMGYMAAHAETMRGKSESGGLLLKLVDKDGKDILNLANEPVTGVNNEQLKLYCQANGIEFNGFVRVLKVEPVDNPTPITGASKKSGIFD